MEEHPKYQAGHESEEERWLTTDELVALARAHREGREYPTPEELLRNLPRMLCAISDFVLSGEADVYHTAYAIASLIEVIEQVGAETTPPESNQH
jgi:hypothetical protein